MNFIGNSMVEIDFLVFTKKNWVEIKIQMYCEYLLQNYILHVVIYFYSEIWNIQFLNPISEQ